MALLPAAILLASAVHAAGATAGLSRVPVLVELFTSEGCSSCPPADAALARLLAEQPVPGAHVIALSEHVDYWDDLGWRDPFSSARFTRRQADYVRRMRLGAPYTPQLVVAGRLQAVGSDAGAARQAIAAAAAAGAGQLELRLGPGTDQDVELGVEARWPGGATAEVVVAAVEDEASSTPKGGENAGRALRHVAVVRRLAVVGQGAGAFSGRVTVPRPAGTSRLVAFVQEPGAGRVLAAGTVELPRRPLPLTSPVPPPRPRPPRPAGAG